MGNKKAMLPAKPPIVTKRSILWLAWHEATPKTRKAGYTNCQWY